MSDQSPEDDRPPDSSAPRTHTSASGVTAAEAIGAYRLLRKIGEGGMGEVWLAEQAAPIRRQVALKVIKAGMDTRQVVGRFEAERQALALMDHPGIARVFDAGETPRGLPFFAMEYVKGEAITSYCDRHRLTTRERLELFTQVCDAVQHAHQKGVIHRDLKPSNVLVSLLDDDPVPKIIDFGVAKAIAQRLTERTLFTEMGVLVGTPEYMSPEQAEMTGLDVDTRTDVYALGIILYELLVGALPFNPGELRQAGFDEIRRRIREVDPPRPSTRVSTLGEASTESARNRRTDPGRLVSLLKGDLDWITMKALEKDRTRRYGSPSELAADIGRHLSDEPVLAGPPSTLYRAGKFIRRHRPGVAVATLGVLALAGFAATMAVQARRIARERNRAERVSDFLVNLFKVSDPSLARGSSITAREVLDKGVLEIQQELAGEPEVEGQLLDTMGRVYTSLGLYPKAEPLIERAVQIRQQVLGPDDPATLDSQDALAYLYRFLGRQADEERLQRKVLQARLRVLGKDDPATLRSMHRVAVALQLQGHYKEAGEIHRQVLEARRRVLGPDHLDTLWSMQNLAVIDQTEGRYDEAVKLCGDVVATRRRALGDDHPDTLEATTLLANLYSDLGRRADAEKLFDQVVEARRRVQGVDHKDTLDAMSGLANVYWSEGRYAEAAALHRQVYDGRRRVLGEEHPDTLRSLNNVAGVTSDLGQHVDAERLYRQALTIQDRVLGKDHPNRLGTVNNLATSLFARGHYAEAEALFREAVEIQVRVRGPDDYDSLLYQTNLADAVRALGRASEAQGILQKTLDIEHRTIGVENPLTLQTRQNLAAALSDEDRQAEAEKLLVETLQTQRRVQGDESLDALGCQAALARIYARQRRFDEAEALLGRTLDAQRRVLGPNRPQTLLTLFLSGCCRALRGDRPKSLDLLRRAVESGFPDAESMLRDPDLRSLRRDPTFLKLVDKARNNSDR